MPPGKPRKNVTQPITLGVHNLTGSEEEMEGGMEGEGIDSLMLLLLLLMFLNQQPGNPITDMFPERSNTP